MAASSCALPEVKSSGLARVCLDSFALCANHHRQCRSCTASQDTPATTSAALLNQADQCRAQIAARPARHHQQRQPTDTHTGHRLQQNEITNLTFEILPELPCTRSENRPHDQARVNARLALPYPAPTPCDNPRDRASQSSIDFCVVAAAPARTDTG